MENIKRVNDDEWHELIFIRNNIEITGKWKINRSELTWVIDGREMSIPNKGNLDNIVTNTLEKLNASEYKEQLSLKACLTCSHFDISGMMQEMAGGEIGVCGLHKQTVQICNLCSEYLI